MGWNKRKSEINTVKTKFKWKEVNKLPKDDGLKLHIPRKTVKKKKIERKKRKPPNRHLLAAFLSE